MYLAVNQALHKGTVPRTRNSETADEYVAALGQIQKFRPESECNCVCFICSLNLSSVSARNISSSKHDLHKCACDLLPLLASINYIATNCVCSSRMTLTYLGGILCEENSLLHGRVTSTNDSKRFLPEHGSCSIADCTGADAAIPEAALTLMRSRKVHPLCNSS